MTIDQRPATDRPTTNLSFRKIRMAISPQRIIRSTSYLVLRWVFGDGESNGAIFGSNKSKMAAAGRHLGKFSNGHISTTCRPIHFMFGSRERFSGTADLLALFLPTTCTANLLCLRRHHITLLLMRKTLELDFVWEGSLRFVGYTVSRQEIKLQLLTGTICE